MYREFLKEIHRSRAKTATGVHDERHKVHSLLPGHVLVLADLLPLLRHHRGSTAYEMGICELVDNGDIEDVLFPVEGDEEVWPLVVVAQVRRLQPSKAFSTQDMVPQNVAHTIVPLL